MSIELTSVSVQENLESPARGKSAVPIIAAILYRARGQRQRCFAIWG